MYRIVLRLGCSRLVLRDFRDRVDLVIGQGAPGPSLPRLDVGNRPLVFRGWYLLKIEEDVVGERVAPRFPFLVMLTSAGDSSRCSFTSWIEDVDLAHETF